MLECRTEVLDEVFSILCGVAVVCLRCRYPTKTNMLDRSAIEAICCS